MKTILIIIITFYSQLSVAGTYNFDTFPEAMAACLDYHATENPQQDWDYTCADQNGSVEWNNTIKSKRTQDVNPSEFWVWNEALECPDSSVLNETTLVCVCPVGGEVVVNGLCVVPTAPLNDPATCTSWTGVRVAFSQPQNAPFSADICGNGCVITDLVGESQGISEIFYQGTYSGASCGTNDVNDYPSNTHESSTDPTGCSLINGKVVCVSDGAAGGDTVDGEVFPDSAAGTATEVNDDYSSDSDTVIDDNDGNDGDSPSVYDDSGAQKILHDDYQTIPPGTPIDTNSDGKPDAQTVDTSGDGISDGITSADSTNFAINNPDGSAGDGGESGVINEDGSPNYGDGGGHGTTDGSGQGTGECTDDSGTPEDECAAQDQDKTGATTPYCDTEPQCEGDPLQCANLYQNWQILCANMPNPQHKESLDVFKDGVDDGKEFYDENTDNTDISEFDFGASAGGWGYSRTCPADIPIVISYRTYFVPLSDYCGLLTILKALILIAAAYISARIIIKGVTG